ncbi:hypothetical protein PENSPDRAFT_679651 [Peniophora sp. CONT]|nr:hypothetical protein PENSPDRAFT_679651 [Peniophora sp. CONT]
MSVLPARSGNPGELALQPSFFTSSLFVEPLREDISSLLCAFSAALQADSQAFHPGVEISAAAPSAESSDVVPNGQLPASVAIAEPFSLFKRLWEEQGWVMLHWKAFDSRSRHSFVRTVCRLFLERTLEGETLSVRAGALFGLYTFFCSQPESSHPPIHRVKYLDIAIDHLQALLKMPIALQSDKRYSSSALCAAHILDYLRYQNVFHVLPASTSQPYIPATLPREIFVPETEPVGLAEESAAQKRPGRPTKKDEARKARAAMTELGRWIDKTNPPEGADANTSAAMAGHPNDARQEYLQQKQTVIDELLSSEEGREALARAQNGTLGRLRLINEQAEKRGKEVGADGPRGTMMRLERAVRDMGTPGREGGMLSLLEGAGMEGAGMPGQDEEGGDVEMAG